MYSKNQSSTPSPLTFASIYKRRSTYGSYSFNPSLEQEQPVNSLVGFRKLPPVPVEKDNANSSEYCEVLVEPRPRAYLKTNVFIPKDVKSRQNNVIDELRFHQLRSQLRVTPTPKASLCSKKTYQDDSDEILTQLDDTSIESSSKAPAIKNPYEHRIQELGLQAEELRRKIAASLTELEQLELAEKSLMEKSSSGSHHHVYLPCSDNASPTRRVHFAPEVNNNNRTDDQKKVKSVLGKRWKVLKSVVKEFFAKK